jgi:hypothetical protein
MTPVTPSVSGTLVSEGCCNAAPRKVTFARAARRVHHVRKWGEGGVGGGGGPLACMRRVAGAASATDHAPPPTTCEGRPGPCACGPAPHTQPSSPAGAHHDKVNPRRSPPTELHRQGVEQGHKHTHGPCPGPNAPLSSLSRDASLGRPAPPRASGGPNPPTRPRPRAT